MTYNGLDEVELDPETFWGRFFGNKYEENAMRRVNNLVASSPIFQIYHDGVLAVVRQYGMTLDDARPGLTELYRKVFPHFVKDGKLSGLNAENVNRLGELFGFTREDMDKLDAEELAKLRSSST
jgi:hypothetical protein